MIISIGFHNMFVAKGNNKIIGIGEVPDDIWERKRDPRG